MFRLINRTNAKYRVLACLVAYNALMTSREKSITEKLLSNRSLLPPVVFGLVIVVLTLPVLLAVANDTAIISALAVISILLFAVMAVLTPSKRVQMESREAMRDTDVLYRSDIKAGVSEDDLW